MNTNPDPDDQKLEKIKVQLKFLCVYFVDKNCNLLILILYLAFSKDVQATREVFSPEKENIQQFKT
jgi:hypothetical protein